ncbi:MAG: hypothetical protein HY875_14195 [Chloroflexi bacterium]|nr:hypothetical protein [Chloroflexota bacterium]
MALGAALILGGAGLMFEPGKGRAEAPLPRSTPAVTPTATATAEPASPTPYSKPTESPTAEPTPVETPPPPPPPVPLLPMGPVPAERVKVQTGDGDCLNVREAPGLRFQSDPRFCVPEGTILWLAGASQAVDGETWRYALGIGWVASRFTVAAPAPRPDFETTRNGFTAWRPANNSITITRFDAKMAVVSSVDVPHKGFGLGSRLPMLSPGGEYLAFSDQGDNGQPRTVVVRVADGDTQEYPGGWTEGWSRDGLLLISVSNGCRDTCKTNLSIVDPVQGTRTDLTEPGESNWGPAWAPDGKSVVTTENKGTGLVRIGLDGTVTPLVTLPEGVTVGLIALSPSGRQLVSGSAVGAYRLVDLESGAALLFSRAKQRTDIGGKCGGAVGQLQVWLDETRFVYHETYAEKGGNGLTVASLVDGSRRVFPFFGVSDIRRVDANRVTFTSWGGVEGIGEVTWILDVRNGEAWPLVMGSGLVPSR